MPRAHLWPSYITIVVGTTRPYGGTIYFPIILLKNE